MGQLANSPGSSNGIPQQQTLSTTPTLLFWEIQTSPFWSPMLTDSSLGLATFQEGVEQNAPCEVKGDSHASLSCRALSILKLWLVGFFVASVNAGKVSTLFRPVNSAELSRKHGWGHFWVGVPRQRHPQVDLGLEAVWQSKGMN